MKGKLAATAAVIRSFNNPHVTKQVRNLLTYGIGKIVVVTDASRDMGSTRGFLGSLLDEGRVELHEMATGYSWSNALNLGLHVIQMANAESAATGKPAFRFVLNTSVEALCTKKHLEAMLDMATDDPDIGIVGTSFVGKQNGNVVDFGRSYLHPRNTLMLIRLEAFAAVFAGFDPRCDSMGGMEDINFLLAILVLTTLRYEMLDLRVPLVVGAHWDQPTKERREQAAMDQIIAMWRSFFPTGTPQRDRIERAIARMGIDRPSLA